MALENSAKKQHKKGIKTTATKNRVKNYGKWHGKMAWKNGVKKTASES
jgi:hypothetical protein